MLKPRRALSSALALFLLPLGGLLAAPAPATAANTDIRINEIITDSDDVDDSIELTNIGSEPVDISGWILKDQSDAASSPIPAGTILAPSGYAAFATSFGLGNGDSARIFLPDGTTLIDGHAFPSHSDPSWSRCPDGTGAFVQAVSETLGAANDCPSADNLLINEVESSGDVTGDWIEIGNPTGLDLDASGLVVKDSDDANAVTVPAGTTVPAGGLVQVFTETNPPAAPIPGDFGLGGSDSARLFRSDGETLIASYSWTAHALTTYGRCPDFIGTLKETGAGTPAEPNDCPLPGNAGDVKINEIITNSGTVADSIELTNIGSDPVDISGWILKDNMDDSSSPIPAGTTLAPGGYLAFVTDFGLGNGDAARLFLSDGITLVDGHTFPAHSNPSWSRCPDGTGAFVQASSETLAAANDCAVTPPPPLDENWDDIEINEISSLNDDDPGNPGFSDAIELVNTGDSDVTIEGWHQIDSGAAANAARLALSDLKVWDGDSLEPATSWVVPAGGRVAFSSKNGLSGEGDAVKVYGPGSDAVSRQLIDQQAYGDGDAGVSDTFESASTAFAACPDGSDEFARVTVNSFGQDNTTSCETAFDSLDTTVVLNEVSNVTGQAELFNTGTDPVDISGWELVDSSDTVVHTVPAATTVPAGGFYLAENIVGLDSADSLTIRDTTGATAIGYTWFEDGIASYSRCEVFGDVTYVETPTSTFGAANACPQLGTEPWPGGSTVTTVDAVDAFTDTDANDEGDVSGASFDPADPTVLWVAMNKGRLFKMRKVGNQYETFPEWDGGKPVRFTSGTGELDAEGVTVGPDGAIYLTSERDNTNSGVSYNKIARFDVGSVTAETTELVATHEWDVNDVVVTGTNLGLEGITYVPDEFLVAAGWEVGGTAYSTATQPTPGLFVTAVEGTGDLHFFSLPLGANPVEVKVESSGFPNSMDVTYDADRQALWALCDDTCGGAYNLLRVVDGDFAVEHSYARPAGMPNLNNEGMAIAPASTCTDGFQEVVWADDGDTGGFSLRAGTLTCPEPEPQPEPEPEPQPEPDPVASTVTVGNQTVTFGKATTLAVTVAAAGVVPRGQVTVTIDGIALPAATLDAAGTVSVAVPRLLRQPRSATYPVLATYTGDGSVRSGSGAGTLTVVKGKAVVKVKGPRKVVLDRSKVRMAVRVTNPDGVRATGTVRIFGSGLRARTVRLVNGRAVIKLPAFQRAGRKKFKITYLGDENLRRARTSKVVRVVR